MTVTPHGRDDGIQIRCLETLDEYRDAEVLQQEVWQSTERMVTPMNIMRIAQKSGGLVLGAFDGTDAARPALIGFLFSFLGWNPDGTWKHCSHMLAVRDAYRNRGLGQQMKHFQYRLAQTQGIPLITWTVDPLECRNNYINFHKLGAVCRQYHRNLYGYGDDALNAGDIPTDRFEVEWHVGDGNEAVQSLRRRAQQAAGPRTPHIVQQQYAARAEECLPGDTASLVLLEVPRDYQQVKQQDLALALSLRMGFRLVCEHLFAAGFLTVDLRVRDTRMYYLLAREEDFA